MSNPQRLAHDPEKVRMKTICLDRRFVFMRCDIAALDENLLAERDPDRISRRRPDRSACAFQRSIAATTDDLLAGENTSWSPTL